MTAATAPLLEHEGSYVDWPAIIAGAIIAAAIGLLFGGFGAALGLSVVSPLENEGSAGWAVIIVGAWMLVTTVVSYGAGGYIAGRMRRRMDNATADEVGTRDSVHGLVVWALGLLIGGWIAASVITSTVSAIGKAAEVTVSAAGSVAEGAASMLGGEGGPIDGVVENPLATINARLLQGTGVQLDSNASLSNGAMAVLAEVARTGEMSEANKAYLAAELAADSNLTTAQAETRIETATAEVVEVRDEAMARVEAAADQARIAAEKARRSAVLTGFMLAAGALIAAAAAVWGASLGGVHRDEGKFFTGFRSF